MTLVGREAQIAELDRLHAVAREGSASAVVLRGEPGQGKTVLLQRLAADADTAGTRVLWVSGSEFGAEVPFGALSSLVWPLSGHLVRLDADHRRALERAVGMDATGTPGLVLFAATLSLLRAAAHECPLVVIVDDAQWIDRSSLDAFLFCVRRLKSERLMVAFATRDSNPRRFADGGCVELDLPGLGRVEAEALLAGHDVASRVCERLRELTSGNPLGLLEVVGSLEPAQRRGDLPLPHPLPIGAHLIDAYATRLRSLPKRSRDALCVAAIESTGSLLLLARVLQNLDLHVEDLEPAERANLIRLDLGCLHWAHPLARAAAHHMPAPSRRRAIHAIVADTLDGPEHAAHIAWHLAAAAPGPDEAIATRLEDVARSAAGLGAWVPAADAFDAASRLSCDEGRRVERWVAMGAALWSAGETERTVRQLDVALSRVVEPSSRARLVMLAAQADAWHAGPPRAALRLERCADALGTEDPGLVAMLLAHASVCHLLAADTTASRRTAAWSRECAARGDQPPALVASAAVAGVAELLGGDGRSSEALLEPLRALLPSCLAAGLDGSETLAQLLAFADIVNERWADAEMCLHHVMRIGEERGVVGLYGFAGSQLAELYWRAGRWREAAAELNHVTSLAEATCQPMATVYAYAHLSLLEAGRGIGDACRRHAGAAIELGDRLGMGAITLRGRHALGLLALGSGDDAEAARQLDQVDAATRACGTAHPGSLWWQADHIEALVRCGERTRASQAVGRLRSEGAAASGWWAAGALQRGEALTGRHPHEVDERYTEAIASFENLPAPFEVARTRLLRGECRLDAGRVEEGRSDVAAARRCFDELGARPWSDRATAALADTPSPAARTSLRLSQAERRVAFAIGEGVTNKEAAERLYLSVKTVDYHLGNIYRKLGVRNRTHLARVLSEEADGGVAASIS